MNRQKNIQETKDPYFENLKANTNISFDFVLWFYRFLKYWYLFAVSIIICLSIAYLKNKSWTPSFMVQALVMLEDRGSSGVVNTVPLGSILRNKDNQKVLLQSYGMTSKTVDRLPSKMFVDYFQQDLFKKTSLYGNSPIIIEQQSIEPNAYTLAFDVNYLDDNNCLISYKPVQKSDPQSVSYTIPFDKDFKCDLFNIKIKKTDYFKSDFAPFSFRFLSKSNLIGMFHGRISLAISSKTSAMSLFLAGNDPSRNLDYMGSLLDEFQDYNLLLKNTQADLTINFLNKQLNIINDSLVASRAALDLFQKETGVYEITSSNLRKEIEASDSEKKKLAIEERAMLIFSEKVNESILGDSKIIEPNSVGITGGELDELVKEYNTIIEDTKYMGPKSPLFTSTVRELNRIRSSILKEIQRSLNILQDRKDLLIDKYQILDLKTENLPPQERDLIKYEREYRVNEMYHQFLTQKRYEAQIQRESNTPDNFIWEAPRITSGPTNAGEINKTYMFWLVVGLFIPVIFVVLKEEVFNYTISSKEECEKISGLPVLGAVENISNKLKAGVVLVKNYPKSSFAESFRNIRVRLEYMAKRENKFSVLVTSAEPGDGKTFIATNIASVYQMMNKKVVLVDLDLRRPSVAKTLQIENRNKGVSNYLIGQVELEDIIMTHPDFGFDVIPAGTLPPNPSELIKTEKTKNLLHHLQETYDYVIVDCSPVGLVSDAYILAPMIDTTLFAIRRGKTNKSFFKSVVTQLKYDGIENVALIFNDVKGREGYYGTSRYYGDKTYYLKKNSYYHDDYFEN